VTRTRLIWIGLFALSLSARSCAAVRWPRQPDRDESSYIAVASSLASLDGFSREGRPETDISPLFPALHAVTIWATGDARVAGVALAILISAAVPLLAGLVFRSAFGEPAGIAAGAAVALHPYLIVAAQQIQPGSLAAVAILCFVWLWMRGRLELAGLMAGLGYLVRPELIFLLPSWLAVELPRRRHARARLTHAGMIGLAVCVPMLLYLRLAVGRWCLTGKDLWVYAVGVGQAMTGGGPVLWMDAERLTREISGILSHIVSHPSLFLKGYAVRSGLMLANLSSLVTPPVLAAAAAGLAWAWRRDRHALALVGFPMLLLALLPIGMTIRRHLMSVAPILIGLAGLGILALGQAMVRRWGGGAGGGR
jgi:hypothetical protein